jgi:hypothetical protein
MLFICFKLPLFSFCFVLSLLYWGLNSGASCQADNWSHVPHPFFAYFSDRVLHFCWGPASDHDPPIYGLSCIWNLMCVPPQLACFLRWALANFLTGWSGTMILLISNSCIAEIIGMYHHTQSIPYFIIGSSYLFSLIRY